MPVILKYRFNSVAVMDGKTGALLQKLPDGPFAGKGVEVWESKKGCTEILNYSKDDDPSTRRNKFIIKEMERALRAIAEFEAANSTRA